MQQDILLNTKPVQDSLTGNNIISVLGTIASECTFSHEVYGEDFYNFYIEVSRLSESTDILPVTISERIMDKEKFKVGNLIYVTGQIRSYNNYVDGENRNRLVLTIFARDCENVYSNETRSPNDVFLNGFICKPPVYRTTPFGREIADLLIAVNRSYNKSDYIPCITWGRNARFGNRLAVGSQIKIWGRMQSRCYQKKYNDGTIIEKTAYEVSASKIDAVQDKASEPSE